MNESGIVKYICSVSYFSVNFWTIVKWFRINCIQLETSIPCKICFVIWATSWENLLMLYANNKGADQPAHPRSLISAFIVRCLDSIIPLVSISEISSLHLASEDEQSSLCLTWPETPKTGFLVMRLLYIRTVGYTVPLKDLRGGCVSSDVLTTATHFPIRFTSILSYPLGIFSGNRVRQNSKQKSLYTRLFSIDATAYHSTSIIYETRQIDKRQRRIIRIVILMSKYGVWFKYCTICMASDMLFRCKRRTCST